MLASACGGTSLPPQPLEAKMPERPDIVLPERNEEESDTTVLWYIPNRIFDFIDIFRLRLRVGPGLAGDVRATSESEAFIGTYSSLYLGLPGARGSATIPSPIGIEAADEATDRYDSEDAVGPRYSPQEFGVGVHLGLIGGDIGVNFWEGWDFLAGFALVDPGQDDL